MRQRDRQAVQLLLGKAQRLDLKRQIAEVWGNLDEDEKTHENCFEMLLVLFPEKKIFEVNIIEDEWGDAEY